MEIHVEQTGEPWQSILLTIRHNVHIIGLLVRVQEVVTLYPSAVSMTVTETKNNKMI